MSENNSRRTNYRPVDVVYSWDNNCLRATPVDKPFAGARCVPFSGERVHTDHDGNPIVRRDGPVMEPGGRGIKPRDMYKIALAEFGDKEFVKSFTYLREGEGYILPKK